MDDFCFIGSHLAPNAEQLLRLQRVAGGLEAADLAVRGGTLLSLHNRELVRRDVLVCPPHIAAVTPPDSLEARREIDAEGCYIAPGFIDTHIHIEYTLLTPGEFARLVVPRGTTSVLADPNCLANVLGPAGMDLAAATNTPLRIFTQVSHKVPRLPGLELGGAEVPEGEVLRRLTNPHAVSLGESNPFELDDSAARKAHRAISAGRRLTGHTARIAERPLWAYAAAGISDDHNAVDPEEVVERLRLGMSVSVMAGSMNDNLPEVFSRLELLAGGLDHITFCADDRHVGDLSDVGHIDHHVRSAIACGVDPIEAYRMASLNAALYYRLDHVLGSVTPTRLADLMLLRDLRDVEPHLVIVGGEIAGRDGEPEFENEDKLGETCRDTVRLHPSLGAGSFRLPAVGENDGGGDGGDGSDEGGDRSGGSDEDVGESDEGDGGESGGNSRSGGSGGSGSGGNGGSKGSGKDGGEGGGNDRSDGGGRLDGTAVVRAMEMYDGYFKRAFEAELPVVDGSVAADLENDVAKIAVVDRHHASETMAVGFVRGFGLRRGALGVTTNCENQNLVVVGTSDAELAHAARTLESLGGGYAVVAEGEVLAVLPLPYGGCMSDLPWEAAYEQLGETTAAARSLGCEVNSPFLTLSFVGLAGVPDYGLTEKGLIETFTQSFLPVLVCCRCPLEPHAGSPGGAS